MTWRTPLRLPDDGAVKLEDLAKRWGLTPAVVARMIVMQRLEEEDRKRKQEEGGHE